MRGDRGDGARARPSVLSPFTTDLIAVYAACLFIRQLKSSTREHNVRGNSEASFILMEANLNGEHTFDLSVFIF